MLLDYVAKKEAAKDTGDNTFKYNLRQWEKLTGSRLGKIAHKESPRWDKPMFLARMPGLRGWETNKCEKEWAVLEADPAIHRAWYLYTQQHLSLHIIPGAMKCPRSPWGRS